MRDRQAVYADVPPSMVNKRWAFLAFLTLLSTPGLLIAFPDNRVLGASVLLAVVAIGATLGTLFPAGRKRDAQKPDFWVTAGAGIGLGGSGLVTGNLFFGLGCALLGFVSYYGALNFNTWRYHRRHGTVEPVEVSPPLLTTEQMLHAVVDDVFKSEVSVEFDSPTEFKHRAHLTDPRSSRTAVLEAAGTWLELRLPDLGVSRLVEDEDDQDKQATLHDLAMVASAYLRGEGWTDQTLGLTGRRPVYLVEVGNRQWELGKSSSRVRDI